jgi:DNA-binding beta-propeller fold protein YncE
MPFHYHDGQGAHLARRRGHFGREKTPDGEEFMIRMLMRGPALAAALTALNLGATANAQIAVSANDNKIALVNGANTIPANPPPDTVTILDIGVSPPKVLGELQAPSSVVGVPQSVAVSKDETFALVTAAMKLDPADPKKLVPDDRVSVIDLKANPPAVIATLQAGAGVTGVSISPSGTLAITANRSEGTLSLFTISGKTLTPAGKIDLGNKASGPSHVAFLPDGKSAIVTRDGDHRVSILSVDGSKVEDTKKFMVGGFRPYSLVVSPKGDVAVFGNQGGGQGDSDQINVVDLKSNPPRVVEAISVGQVPEGVSMAPDGSHVAVVLHNGANRPKNHPAYNEGGGLMRIFKVDGTKLTLVTSTKIGTWAQGSVWSADGKTIVVQATHEKELQVFAFDGKEAKLTGTIKTNGSGVGMRTSMQ